MKSPESGSTQSRDKEFPSAVLRPLEPLCSKQSSSFFWLGALQASHTARFFTTVSLAAFQVGNECSMQSEWAFLLTTSDSGNWTWISPGLAEGFISCFSRVTGSPCFLSRHSSADLEKPRDSSKAGEDQLKMNALGARRFYSRPLLRRHINFVSAIDYLSMKSSRKPNILCFAYIICGCRQYYPWKEKSPKMSDKIFRPTQALWIVGEAAKRLLSQK